MWSGPRNISTALLRSWGNRADTLVCDEPLYAHYLFRTGLHHPLREQVIASQPTDWRAVVACLLAPLPAGKTIFYQKHMAHHLLPEIGRSWIGQLTNALLIRDPREMLTSLVKNIERPTLDDTGLPQQVELYENLASGGDPPPVIDARDVLLDPPGMLGHLCARLSVPFDPAMLHWPAGRRATDGVWAAHWYHAVEQSTGFQQYQPKAEPLPAELEPLAKDCQGLYERLHAVRERLET